MSSRIADHIRRNIYGLIAIFIALSGTAYAVDGPLAGQNQVGSADIINGEVGSDDIGTGQVKAPELALDSVNSGRIVDGQVGAAEIGQGGVGTGEVANDSLVGADILNGSLTSADLAKHTIVRDDLAFTIEEPLTAAVGAGGSLLHGNGATSATRNTTGIYSVHFEGVDVRNCVPQATIMFRGNSSPPNGEISVPHNPEALPDPSDVVSVFTWDSTAFGGGPPALSDRPFLLTVNC